MSVETHVPPDYQLFQTPVSSEDLILKKKVQRYIAAQSEINCFLDSNQNQGYSTVEYQWIAACKPKRIFQLNKAPDAPELADQLGKFLVPGSWYFSVLGYDLKNYLENLASQNIDLVEAPDIACFEAAEVICLQNNQLSIFSTGDPQLIWQKISLITEDEFQSEPITVSDKVGLKPEITREKYLSNINHIKKHILDGDVYELNYCQAFLGNNTGINHQELFAKMGQKTKAPFSAYFQFNGITLISSSPERFLKKTGNKLISQPIKGTIARNPDPELDTLQKQKLRVSEKDMAENVMIVDLVRNDLSRSCLPGSVRVDELFGIYSFEKVHHMISTVSGQLKENVHWIDALLACFPMGSMTGAPKLKSMELIDEYESFKRSWYSGAVGYINPEQNFDFSVIIRSIVTNRKTNSLMIAVGGAIVFDSVAELEYEESLLKAKSLFELLEENFDSDEHYSQSL